MAQEAKILRIETDAKADALYICLSDQRVAYSEELTDDVVADFASDKSIVGFDIQRASAALA